MREAQKVETQQVAQFVAQAIEIVEYQRFHSQCSHCGQVSVAAGSDSIIPGQDLVGLKQKSSPNQG